METLIKSPLIGEGAVELYPQLSSSPKLADKPVSTSMPGSAKREDKPSKSPLMSQDHLPAQAPARPHEAPPSVAPAADQTSENKLKELLQAQQSSLKEAEAKAVSEGFAKGLAEGQRKGEEQYAAAAQSLAALVESGKQSLGELLQESEDVIAAIVFEAVSKIIGQELATLEGCSAAVRQVLARASAEESISVRVSPKDHQRLKAGIASNPEAAWAIQLTSLPLEADDRVELGGCILSLKDGNIDGRIETQFRALAQSLKDAAKRR